MPINAMKEACAPRPLLCGYAFWRIGSKGLVCGENNIKILKRYRIVIPCRPMISLVRERPLLKVSLRTLDLIDGFRIVSTYLLFGLANM